MSTRTPLTPAPPERSDFNREIVAADLRKGRHQTVATRFPSEPNGYLHRGWFPAAAGGYDESNTTLNGQVHEACLRGTMSVPSAHTGADRLSIGERRSTAGTPISPLIWVPLTVLLAAVIVLKATGPWPALESAVLLTLLNALFLTAIAFIVAFLAGRTYLVGGGVAPLSLMVGTLVIGLVSALAGPMIRDLDAALATYNIGMLIAAVLFLLGGLMTGAAKPGSRRRRRLHLIVAGSATLVPIGIIAALSLLGRLPSFWQPDEGSTLFRDGVLTAAVVAFLGASCVYAWRWRTYRHRMLLWLSAGFAAFTLGLAAVLIVDIPGSWLGWAGRFGNYLGGLYLLAGAIAAVQQTGALALPLKAALEESEQRFRIMADGLPTPIWVTDTAGGLLFVNQAYCEFFGVEEEQVRGEGWIPLVHDTDRQRFVEVFRAAVDEHIPFHIEARVRRADGAWRWVEASGVPRSSADDRYMGMVGSSADVTERREQYEQQALIAAELQAGLVHPLPEAPGLRLARRSVSADRPALVGGDFGEAFLLSEDRVGLLIGDVEGKGISAAGLTGTVTSAARAFASSAASSSYVLSHLNRLLLSPPSEQYVTALVAVFNRRSGVVSIASAGHPAPVRQSGQSARLLDIPTGPALGIRDYDYDHARFTLAPGERLVFYTDGLIEARIGPRIFGDERLLRAAEQLSDDTLEELLDGLLYAARTYAGELLDDVELLGVEMTGDRGA